MSSTNSEVVIMVVCFSWPSLLLSKLGRSLSAYVLSAYVFSLLLSLRLFPPHDRYGR